MQVLASTGAVQAVWWLSLGAGLVAVAMTGALLTLILRSAQRIETGVRAISNLVPQMAENTAQVALLTPINETAVALLDAGGSIAVVTSQIMMHAAVCPECPACVSNPV